MFNVDEYSTRLKRLKVTKKPLKGSRLGEFQSLIEFKLLFRVVSILFEITDEILKYSIFFLLFFAQQKLFI